MNSLLLVPASSFMMIVGISEIIAGFIVLIRAEIGGYIVEAWLASIALTLLAGFNCMDMAVLDLIVDIWLLP